ncbi:hypothetical protein [Rahnella contaminans]|uniref:hypothetical protein n=1 Tax=Rahnella contaminans TaxID=2703882 RepID=UPI003C300714
MELNYIKFTESVIDLVLTSLKEARAFRVQGEEEAARRCFNEADTAFTVWTHAVEHIARPGRNEEILGAFFS